MRLTIQVRRPKGRDLDTGEKVAGWNEHSVAGCIVYPRTGGPGTASRDVESRGREGVIEGLTVVAPFDADIRHTDEVEVPAPFGASGEWWKVDGEVGRWQSPFSGRRPGCEFAIRRAAG